MALAGSFPTKMNASPGVMPWSAFSLADSSAMRARNRVAAAFPSMMRALMTVFPTKQEATPFPLRWSSCATRRPKRCAPGSFRPRAHWQSGEPRPGWPCRPPAAQTRVSSNSVSRPALLSSPRWHRVRLSGSAARKSSQFSDAPERPHSLSSEEQHPDNEPLQEIDKDERYQRRQIKPAEGRHHPPDRRQNGFGEAMQSPQHTARD